MLTEAAGWICQQWSENYFKKTEVESIQTTILKLDKQAKKLAIAA